MKINLKVTICRHIFDFLSILKLLLMIKEYWNFKSYKNELSNFIAITALARLIIMGRKNVDPSAYVYESVAILILAIAIVVLRVRHMEILNRKSINKQDD